jgi:hypothetical protein
MDLIRALRQFTLMMAAVTVFAMAEKPAVQRSQWVHLNRSGKLVYQHFKRGDRILDFSYAGYMGGGIALPQFPVKRTVAPSGGDDSAAIQGAIDEVSNLSLHAGVRGAVLLTAGRFQCKTTLNIRSSGVVLRGGGSGEDGTVIEMTGDPHLAFSVAGQSSSMPVEVL